MPPKLLQFECPHCKRIAKVEKRLQPFGKKLQCKGCEQEFELSEKNLQTSTEATKEVKLMSFFCPNCKRVAKVEKRLQPFGKKLQCKGCAQEFELSENNLQSSEDTKKKLGTSKIREKRTLGRYALFNELGKGGMGKVYRAHDPEEDRFVAIKVLITGATTSESQEKRFLREAETTAQLEHPNIVKVYDIGYTSGQYYFTMEIVEGTTLDKYTEQKVDDKDKLLKTFIKVGNAVEYAHAKGFVHRDLKPANIMITVDGEPKIMDFGLVKLLQASNKLTATGMILGTLKYMAPEQAKGEPENITHHCDIYALGIILYEILTGKTPFESKIASKLIAKIISEVPVPPHEINSEISENLSNVCLKAIEKDIEKRYQNVTEFIQALQHL